MELSIRNLVNNSLRKFLWNFNKLASTYGLQAYAVIWITAMMLGYYGYYQYYHYGYYNHHFKVLLPWTEILYQTFQLFALKSSVDWSTGIPFIWQLEAARWMALLFTSVTAGMLLVLGVFSRKTQSLVLWTISDHVIICGSGRIGSRLIKKFSKEYPIVVIEQNKESPSLEGLMHSGILIVYGDARDTNILKSAGVKRAKYLVTALGDDNANAEVAIQAKRLMEKRKNGKLTCLINILDPKLCDLIKIKEFDYINDEKFKLEFFNLYEKGAKLLFEKYPLLNKSKCSSANAHLLVVGLGNMGESLVIEAAKRCWSNYVNTKNRLNVTVVDKDASAKVNSMCLRYPNLDNFCKMMPKDIEISSSNFLKDDFQKLLSGEFPVTAIFVCLMDDSDGLSTAFLLHHYLNEKKIPIVVRMNSDEGLASLVIAQNNNSLGNLHSFRLWDQTCNTSIIDGTSWTIAQAIHEEYYEEQRKRGVKENSKPTMRPWNKLDKELQLSNLDTAHHVTTKMAAVLCSFSKLTDWEAKLFDFQPIEIVRLGMLEHDRWCMDKIKDGWKHSEERDDDNKRHPSLVPWAKLSPDDKKKDFDNILKISRVLSRVDINIRRIDLIELIAQTLYQYYQAQKDHGVNKISWWESTEKVRNDYSNEAKCIKSSLEKCGFDITGYIEGESLGEINAKDVDYIAKAYYEMSLEDISHTENNSPRRSWTELSEETRQLCRSKVDFWPEMFIRSKMQMYNVSRLMETYKMDLKLLEDFYQNS